jgi:mono/diheme cytochrome c family protein
MEASPSSGVMPAHGILFETYKNLNFDRVADFKRFFFHICLSVFFIALGLMVFTACRGQKSIHPPYHLVQNMDFQPKFRAYGENLFFQDRMNMRPLPEGTIPRGHLNEDEGLYSGVSDSQYVSNPLELNRALLVRGQDRYDIFCAVCHGRAGDGKGIMVQKGFTPAPSYHEERIMAMADGQLFSVITGGIRTMPAMKNQVPVKDRWAIVSYIRALQRSQRATLDDVPAEEKEKLD